MGRVERARCVSEGTVAGQCPSVVLHVPHHGWSRNDPGVGHGPLAVDAVAWLAVQVKMAVVAAHALRPLPLHRHDGRLGEDRALPPTLASLLGGWDTPGG